MASRSISVVMESSYRSGLTKGLRQDLVRIDRFQKYLDGRPLRIPVRLDLSGLQSQAATMRKIVLGEFAARSASILGADGRAASLTSSGKATNAPTGLIARTTSTGYKDGVAATRNISELQQLGRGLQEVNRYKQNLTSGDNTLLSSVRKDISSVADLRDALRNINADLRNQYGVARGRGDKRGQIVALEKQRSAINEALLAAKGDGMQHSPAYIQAENQIAAISQRVAALHGGLQTKAEKETAAAARGRFDNKLRNEEERVDRAQRANKVELVHANQISDLTQREAALNRIYDERKKIFTDSQRRFQSVDASRLSLGDSDGAGKAMRRGLNMAGHAAQVDFEQARAQAALADHRSAERKIQHNQAATDRAAAFNRELQDISGQSAMRIAAINAAERNLKAATTSQANKRQYAKLGHEARQAEFGNRATQYAGVESRARAAGNITVADAARGRRLSSEVAGSNDLTRFAASATAGGHALDFHSTALLRNAVTYARWMIPVQAVMGMTSAFSAGVEGAVRINRQFATLQAVFQGTREEAQKLKVETLDLATSQGRSAVEAMDAAIRWSRLGLSRVQVLEATRVSLQAANVAEISSADAAEKLSAIYATFRLNVGDLGGVLNALNSISNNYNVTVDDMFEGVSRVGGIAKQSGLELMDLAGIIGSVVGATGRPGAEVGNAIKFVITRLASPDAMQGLKKHFNIDLSEPNGDLKDMSKIVRELADVFPTLNNAQKQTFLSLTAGARQASRFALVLDQYRQGQALAAQAMNDTGVTAAENQLILESLESRLQSLKTSWTELFTAIGDAGAFERAGEFFRYLQTQAMQAKASFDEAAKAAGTIIINNPVLAETVERAGTGENTAFGTRGKFTKDETQSAIDELQKFIDSKKKSGIGNKIVSFMQGPGKFDEIHMPTGWLGLGSGISFKNIEAAEKRLADLKKLTGDGGDAGPQDKLTAMTASATFMRNRMKQMDTFRANMDSYSKEVVRGKMDPEKRYRDFETTARGLQNLPDGQALYSRTIGNYQQLAKNNDNTGISNLAATVSDLFKSDYIDTNKKYDAANPGVISALEKTLYDNSTKRQELQKQLADDSGSVASKMAIVGQLKELDQVSAAANRELATLKDAVKELMNPAFSVNESTAIGKYLDDIMAQAKGFRDAFNDLAPDAEADPVERIFKRRASAAGLTLDMLQHLQTATAAVATDRKTQAEININNVKSTLAGGFITPREADKTIAVQQNIINQQDSLNEEIARRIVLEKASLQTEVEKLALAQQVATLARVQTDASKAAADSSLAWRFGETDSDKNANQALAAVRRANAGIIDSERSAVPGSMTDSPATRAGYAGQVLQDEATARRALETLKTRGYEIDAATKQVAFDTVKALREQTNEAEKRYMLASREDQLRAAAMARTLSDRSVTSNEFFGLSQESRQAMVNYFPNDVPGGLNSVMGTRDTSLSELGAEKSRLTSLIGEINGGLASLSRSILKDTGNGGSLDVVPRGGDAALQDAVRTRENSPIVAINVGNVDVNVQLKDQMERIISNYVDRKLNADLSAMEARLNRATTPSAPGVAE